MTPFNLSPTNSKWRDLFHCGGRAASSTTASLDHHHYQTLSTYPAPTIMISETLLNGIFLVRLRRRTNKTLCVFGVKVYF
jgi:hypothetical protein